MATESFEISDVISATPDAAYGAWLDGEKHSRMTGGTATGSSASGAEFTAWGSCIRGKNFELVPGARIVRSWWTTQFSGSATDSQIEVTLEAVDGCTRLTLRHTDIPEGQGKGYEAGWADHYFEPIKAYFSGA